MRTDSTCAGSTKSQELMATVTPDVQGGCLTESPNLYLEIFWTHLYGTEELQGVYRMRELCGFTEESLLGLQARIVKSVMVALLYDCASCLPLMIYSKLRTVYHRMLL